MCRHTGKRRLDVAIHGRQEELAVDNTADGHAALSAFLRQYGVKRVGIEASGGFLARRLDLIASVDGIGERTAVAILVRMPEIGRLSREQAAALVGLAPYDDYSGEHKGQRRIDGARERLRTSLYAAALPAAFRWNDQLIALYQRARHASAWPGR